MHFELGDVFYKVDAERLSGSGGEAAEMTW